MPLVRLPRQLRQDSLKTVCGLLCLIALFGSVAARRRLTSAKDTNCEAGNLNCIAANRVGKHAASPQARHLRKKLIRQEKRHQHDQRQRNALGEPIAGKVRSDTTKRNEAARFAYAVRSNGLTPGLLNKSDASKETPAIDNIEEHEKIASNVQVNHTGIVLIRLAGVSEDKPVCRLHGVCRSGDGAYLLPHWMKEYSGHIAKCGLRGEVHYVLHETTTETVRLLAEGSMYAEPDKVWSIRGLRRSKINLSQDFSAFDMIGGKAPRELKHWMITDLTPTVYIMDMSSRFKDYQEKGKVTSYECVEVEGHQCSEENAFSDLNPLLLVDVRITEQKSYHWPKGLLRLLQNSFSGKLQISDAQDVYGWHLRSQASCFRSLITTAAAVPDLPDNAFDSTHMLWRANMLSRKSVNHHVEDEKKEDGERELDCTRRVLLLNKYGKRYMVGHDKLRAAIEAVTKESVTPNYPNIRILAETVFFENSSFPEQVSVMQESNVVVSSHGSSNANIVFLRLDTLLIEITPFSLEVDTYSNLARTFGINYKMVMAQPDEEVFFSCVKHFNPTMLPGVSRMMKEWSIHAEKFRQAATASHRNPTTSFRIPDSDDEGVEDGHVRECATYQRLSFNVVHIAKMVVAACVAQCGVTER